MIVTLDTNVLYQALYSKEGASYYILQIIRAGLLQFAISVPVFHEYEDVLSRKQSLDQFKLDVTDIRRFLGYIAYSAKIVDPHFLFRPNLRDEADNMFIELAIASQSEYLITNNIKDFKNAELRFDHLKFVTPGDFARIWRKHHG